ncbi:type I restriction enzyme endonuclease domain-containing protein [Streptomyces sp. AcE210]|uniref:type I restriction enzyme endonuclease domain-containing protein n=1 Tax=Streptomyces sp. AcE210 TaxID=2292703 RepID=UPI001F0BEB29|nr:type I restriction enzyme endonuclease domain-containing protein [Streptomyces sp. AcE210]
MPTAVVGAIAGLNCTDDSAPTSARELMGDETLAEIARELVVQIRQQLKPDWISREPVRAKLRTTIKRLLARRGYPPKQDPVAIELVLKQMEHFANEWSTDGTAAR